MQTISQRVDQHIPTRDEDKDTDNSQGHSEPGETESISEFSSGALDEGYVTIRSKDGSSASSKPKSSSSSSISRPKGSHSSSKRLTSEEEGSLLTENKSYNPEPDKPIQKSTLEIKLKTPKDYDLQWEETIDRLTSGPNVPLDVSDMSPRSPRELMRGTDRIGRSRSASSESEVYGTDNYTPVWKKKEYFEKR